MAGLPGDLHRPTLLEALSTGLLVVLAFVALAVAPARELAFSAAFWSLELVGRMIDRPTWLVVLGYLALIDAAAIFEGLRRRDSRAGHRLGSVLAPLALITAAYLAAQAWMLEGRALVLGLGAAALGWLLGRRSGRADTAPRVVPPGVLLLFVTLHMAVEGAAGHILTPWLHDLGVLAARLSHSPVYGLASGLLIVAPAALLASSRRDVGACALAALPALVNGGGWLSAAFACALAGAFAARSGRPLITWAHPDPLRLLGRGSLAAIVALICVTAHYSERSWDCRSADGDERLARLSSAEGTFDLAMTGSGRFLVASLREPQELLVLDLEQGTERRVPTRKDADTLFDRTEPETLLPVGIGERVLLLMASSDSEEGNQLVPFDAAAGRLGKPLQGVGEGVSDLVGDGAGGAWISTEFRGRILQLDPRSLSVRTELQVARAETNKIVVDAAAGEAFSVGLWSDAALHRVSLDGRELAARRVGTHQWDLAYDPEARRLLLPRLVDGLVHVLDADTLKPLATWDAGFGVRPIELSFDGSLAVTGNLYSGELIGWDAASGARRWTHAIGGPIKGLHVSSEGRVFSGSHCGIFEVLP